MGESLWVSVLVSGNSDCFDASSLREEVFQSILISVETQVTTKDCSGLTRSWRFITTSRITRELYPNLPSIKSGFIGTLEGSDSLLMSFEFNKGLALIVQELALGQSAISLVALPQAIVSSIK